MQAPTIHPLLWLLCCMLLRGTATSTDPSVPTVTGQSQPATGSPEVQNHTSEPSVKSTPPTTLSLTSTAPTAAAKAASAATTLLTSTARDEKPNGGKSTRASPTQGQEPQRSESTTTSATQSASSFLSQRGTSTPATPTPQPSGYLPVPTPTDDKSPLTVAAFGVISFIVILIVVVIILVSVVSLRFKCNHSKDSEDKQKPGSSMVSESCSAGSSQKDNSITLISMKNINMNNSMSYPPSEKNRSRHCLETAPPARCYDVTTPRFASRPARCPLGAAVRARPAGDSRTQKPPRCRRPRVHKMAARAGRGGGR
ncbi:endothelial cell-specific chemotaxis regulator [Indicator indicator]|uniref:endothelial cell-specific chemotaxis regulator n=1 Tax=Indicator indicator TaxID=1002788 RepID=UPI0023DE9583|nr:endothelial cell-specific chemotaxis regulator [Indicator indicator]